MRATFFATVALAAVALGNIGCAGHEDRTRTALAALDRGMPREAVAALNEELGVARIEDPPVLKGDNALLLLDRATVLQSVDRFDLSARDFGTADKSIDMLDMSRSGADDLGKYLFSDSAGPYKAPPYEKLLINTINMMNYLAQHDVAGAKVEARRLAVMQKYVREHEDDSGLVGLGSFLAGFTFEKAGDMSEALGYYEDALKYAGYRSLRDPLRVLTQGKPRSPAIDALVGGAGALPPVTQTGEGEIVVLVGFGRIPQKVPVRVPIGLALTMVSGALAPGDAAKANALAAKGLVTWVNYPALRPGKGGYAVPSFFLDERSEPMEEAIDLESHVVDAWQKKEQTIVVAAITRMIARLVAGEIAQGATEAAGGRNAGALGLLAGLATTATLAAFDTPDTRGWSTLPARIAIARRRVPAGNHVVRLGARGTEKQVEITVPAGGWAVVPLMVLR
ncbi:putative lipoprotein [Minicystis rosea]|nr:putative lipoprotein [Minicystis rosea]